MDKTTLMQLIEMKQGRPIEDLLTDWIEEGLCWTQIAKRLGIPYSTLNDWRQSRGITVVRTLRFPRDDNERATP